MIMPALRNRPWLTVFGALLISMALLVSNASATFQGTASAAHAITVASMSITVGTNNVTTGSTTIAPGDTIDRVIDLTPAGTASMFNGWTLTVTASPGTSNLYTQCAAACAGKGLRVTVDLCSVAWTGTVAVTAYTCSGSTSSVLSITDANAISAASLSNMSNSAINRLRIRMTFPGGSSDDDTYFQPGGSGVGDTVTFTFHGVQRAGTAK
jgi:hypothetical protein